MKEIKFRAWHKTLKCFLGTQGTSWHHYGAKMIEGVLESNESIIEQYIGITDKTGKPIYEGDILMVPIMDGCSPDIEKRAVKSIESLYNSEPCIQWSKGVIIGNIHEEN